MADVTGLPGEDHPEERARTVQNLKFIGWAMHMFARQNGGRLPTAAVRMGGEPLLSWRVMLLPFLEESMLFKRFHLNESWDSPHNSLLLEKMPGVYRPVIPGDATPDSTYYQGVVGRGALFDGEEGTRISDVIDAGRPTLMIVEAAHPVPWTRPEDVPYEDAGPLPVLGGQFADGSYAGFADGSVGFLGHEIAPERLRLLITQKKR